MTPGEGSFTICVQVQLHICLMQHKKRTANKFVYIRTDKRSKNAIPINNEITPYSKEQMLEEEITNDQIGYKFTNRLLEELTTSDYER